MICGEWGSETSITDSQFKQRLVDVMESRLAKQEVDRSSTFVVFSM